MMQSSVENRESETDGQSQETVHGQPNINGVDEASVENGPVTEAEDAAQLENRRQSQLRHQSRFTRAEVLIPPENFAYVEDGLYRSGQPIDLNFPFLQRLRLKSLVWLAPEEPHQRFLDFMREEGIQLHHLGVLQASNAWDPISEAVVLKALDIILQPSSYPLMIMCNLGRHRTGTVVGCLRKLQRWNLSSVFEEYRRHAGSRVRIHNEQFIELFDTDLVAVPSYPPTPCSATG